MRGSHCPRCQRAFPDLQHMMDHVKKAHPELHETMIEDDEFESEE